MAPGSNERHPPPPSHTGTIPKTKIRNCVVPQEAVTPTRRDINSSNLVSTSLDWVPVPVSEYNSRSSYPQSSRNTTNNTVEHDFSHLDNTISLESALQRFVPVRPQPRGLPLPMQPPSEHSDDSMHLYHHPNANGVSPHGNHGAAAVMIVNPTTPNTVTGNSSQPYNISGNANRNNLARAFHSARNSSEAGSSNNVHAAAGRTKTNNINSNLFEPAHLASSHRAQPPHMNGVGDTESLGEVMVAACPDPASVERRLGQIREYIRVTSCLVDTMRNSEDEAYIEHTKEEYDELVEMVMKLKESENKLMNLMNGMEPENNEVLPDTEEGINKDNEKHNSTNPFVGDTQPETGEGECTETLSPLDGSSQTNITLPESDIKPNDRPQAPLLSDNKTKLNTEITLTFVKKVTNIENEQLNKSNFTDTLTVDLVPAAISEQGVGEETHSLVALSERHEIFTNKPTDEGSNSDFDEVVTAGIEESSVVKTDEELNELLRMNIISCNEKLATMEVLKEAKNNEEGCERGAEQTVKFCKLLDLLALGGAPDLATNMSSQPHTNYHESAPPVRPVSVQSNGSGYSDNELWQNELKAKMEVSQQRLAALQDQQKRLLKYQAEAKQQLAEMHTLNRNRQAAESAPRHTPPAIDHAHHAQNTHSQHNLLLASNQQSVRMYNSNQIGVATTLPHATNTVHHHIPGQLNVPSGCLPENYRAASSSEHADSSTGPHHRDDRFTMRNTNLLPQVEGVVSRGSDEEEVGQEELSPHGRQLQHKLRDLQRKKQHMENLVAEFQKLQAAQHLLDGSGGGGGGEDEGTVAGKATARHNTYSSDESEGEDNSPPHKCNKSDANIKNEDPFKLMEISAIKAALQKTKDLMRTVERYEPQEPVHEDNFQHQHSSHSNINDNKSEGGGSAGEWSTEGSVCRSIRNTIQPSGKLTNHTQPHHSGGGGGGSGAHEASISSLQLLAQQLKQEAENISMERQRLRHSLSRNKEGGSKLSQKKVNAEMCGSSAGTEASRSSPGPLERKQAALRAELAEKQRQLQMILNKEKELPSSSEVQNMKADCSYSAINHSYNSEQEEGDSQVDEVLFPTHPHTQTHHHHYRSEEGSVYGESALSALPLHMQPATNYCSDSDTGCRGADVQRVARSRRNRATPPERQPPHLHARTAQTAGVSSVGSRSGSALAEPRVDQPHTLHPQPGESSSSTPSYPAQLSQPPPTWNNKSNQDARSNQFTQNSYSQTMERLLGSQQMPFPPSVPFNMMMPYGMVSGTACGCSWWGPWCWQQLTEQQREIHQLREQLNNLEERWRAETAPHALNNQVPPGNRANNYWDNFRSYSRQNLLSVNSKTNADGHLGSVPLHNPHPLVERSHNALHPAPAPPAPAPAPTSPANTPKRNSNGARRHNMSYETQHSLPSAPDVLNVNQHVDTDIAHGNINRDTSLPERNLNRAEPIPEIIQAHSSNLNRTPDSVNTKKKSSSKLPAKNSANRRNYSLDFVQNSNINIASTSEAPNPNLASTSRDHSQDKATSKLFDLLRENVYSEVTALISANELHPDFLIQLFRDLQRVSSDSMRQHTLQSIRDLLSHCVGTDCVTATADTAAGELTTVERSRNAIEDVSSTNSHLNAAMRDGASIVYRDIVDFMIARGEEICSPDVLETFKALIIESHREAGQSIGYSQKRLQELLSKYEGMRLRDVSGDIIEDLITVQSATDHEDTGRQQSEVSESSVLQDEAGALNLFSSSDSHLHQLNSNAYEAWGSASETNAEREHEGRFAQKGKVDLIECVEMYNGDLAEADQTCPGDTEPAATDAGDLLPDVVENEEATPTEAEAEWLGLDRVPTRLHVEDSPANQKE